MSVSYSSFNFIECFYKEAIKKRIKICIKLEETAQTYSRILNTGLTPSGGGVSKLIIFVKKNVLNKGSQKFCGKTFLRTASSSMIHFGTYILTLQVIFQGTHPTLNLHKQKVSQMIQVHVPTFFDQNPKNDRDRAKKKRLF